MFQSSIPFRMMEEDLPVCHRVVLAATKKVDVDAEVRVVSVAA